MDSTTCIRLVYTGATCSYQKPAGGRCGKCTSQLQRPLLKIHKSVAAKVTAVVAHPDLEARAGQGLLLLPALLRPALGQLALGSASCCLQRRAASSSSDCF